MSYVALATDDFERAAKFYGEELRLRQVAAWDRPTGRGRRFDAGGGLRLELLDNARQRHPAELGPADGRVHVVIEVEDVEGARDGIGLDVGPVQRTSWGAHLFQVEAPDGVRVTFLQWTHGDGEAP